MVKIVTLMLKVEIVQELFFYAGEIGSLFGVTHDHDHDLVSSFRANW